MLSVLINTHLLMASRAADVARYFYTSSACVYNADKQRGTDVVALREADAYPAMPEDGSGWEKLFSERMCRHFRVDFGLQTRIARFHKVYGPLGTYAEGPEKTRPPSVRGSSRRSAVGATRSRSGATANKREASCTSTASSKGTLAILESDIIEPINLGSRELVSINQPEDIVEGIAGIELRRHYFLDAPKGVRDRNSDSTMFQERLGWETDITLRDRPEGTYYWISDELTSPTVAQAHR